MEMALTEFAERLVPISDFSQGKAGKIFQDVAKNNREYIVLKNNQPVAVLVSMEQYKRDQEKIARLEKFSELLEDAWLLKQAESRDNSKTTSFEEFIRKEGFSMDELKKMAESVVFE